MIDQLKNIDARSAEPLAEAYYMAKGYNVSKPNNLALHYDLVIEKDGEFKTVNVKLAGLKNKDRPNSWSINANIIRRNSLSNPYKLKVLKKPDIYAVWMPNKKDFVELPSNFFDGQTKGNNKLLPKELRHG